MRIRVRERNEYHDYEAVVDVETIEDAQLAGQQFAALTRAIHNAMNAYNAAANADLPDPDDD